MLTAKSLQTKRKTFDRITGLKHNLSKLFIATLKSVEMN